MTPSVATRNEERPTFSIGEAVDSRPTSKSSRRTPSCASMSIDPSGLTAWNQEYPKSWRFPSTTPTTSSPKTAGWPSLAPRSPPSLAATGIRARARSMGPTGSEWLALSDAEARAGQASRPRAVDNHRRSAKGTPTRGWIRMLVCDRCVQLLVLGQPVYQSDPLHEGSLSKI